MEDSLSHPDELSDLDCPVCGKDLELADGTASDGTLHCGSCGVDYEVRDGKLVSIRR